MPENKRLGDQKERQVMKMPLVSGQTVLLNALSGHHAVGAFNANGSDMILGTIAAAEEMHSPVIVQISPGAINYSGLMMAAAMVRAAAAEVSVPVVLHLDHGQNLAVNQQCAEAQFSSLMFDGSELELNKWKKAHEGEEPGFDVLVECVQGKAALDGNIAATREVVEMASKYPLEIGCIPVEAELGHIPKIEQMLTEEEIRRVRDLPPAEAVQLVRERCGKRVEALMADPAQAAKFVKATGCLTLAAAFGSIHGMPADIWPIRLDRLQEVRQRTGVGIVSHGSSGILRTQADAEKWGIELLPGEGTLEDAVRAGLVKVNVATAVSMTYLRAFDGHRKLMPDERDFRKPGMCARDAVKVLVSQYMSLLGSAGKAA